MYFLNIKTRKSTLLLDTWTTEWMLYYVLAGMKKKKKTESNYVSASEFLVDQVHCH